LVKETDMVISDDKTQNDYSTTERNISLSTEKHKHLS